MAYYCNKKARSRAGFEGDGVHCVGTSTEVKDLDNKEGNGY
jgi:hypothetical protein